VSQSIANQELMINRFDLESKLLKQSNLEVREQLKLNVLELIGKEIKEMYEEKLENFIEYQSDEFEYKWRVNVKILKTLERKIASVNTTKSTCETDGKDIKIEVPEEYHNSQRY